MNAVRPLICEGCHFTHMSGLPFYSYVRVAILLICQGCHFTHVRVAILLMSKTLSLPHHFTKRGGLGQQN